MVELVVGSVAEGVQTPWRMFIAMHINVMLACDFFSKTIRTQALSNPTERGGFEEPRIARLLTQLYLQQKARNFKNLDSLESLLSSHGFLL